LLFFCLLFFKKKKKKKNEKERKARLERYQNETNKTRLPSACSLGRRHSM
jgi:hypothetical protein